jgi:hypothetical protein
VPIATKPISQTRFQPGAESQQKRKQKNMKKQTHTNLIIRSSVALALTLAIWTPGQARSAEPTAGMMMGGKMMSETNMTPRHQAMQERRGKMMADMQAQDAQLTGQITEMNSAPENKKLDLMAAIVTRMLAQRTAMNTRMQNMQGEMMGNMMPTMQMDTNSMSQDSTMQGMKGMGEKSGDAQEKQK